MVVARLLCITLLGMSILSGTALACLDRLEKIDSPSFPKTKSAIEALEVGPCSVTVDFRLLEDGSIEISEVRANASHCEIFEGLVRRSVEAARFKPGDRIDECEITIKMRVSEDVSIAHRSSGVAGVSYDI